MKGMSERMKTKGKKMPEKDKIFVREVEPYEHSLIVNELSEYGDLDPTEFSFFVVEGKRKEVFATTKEASKVFSNITHDIHSIGIAIGRIKKGGFDIGLEASNLFSKIKKYVVINEKAGQLFLYGKDVFEDSVMEKRECSPGEKVFVLNENGECLGIGLLRGKRKGKSARGEARISVLNVLDRGLYLRKWK
jgi:60S ribosome subunit biogenesis protein NIP7